MPDDDPTGCAIGASGGIGFAIKYGAGEGPIAQERFHKLRLREVFQLGNDLNSGSNWTAGVSFRPDPYQDDAPESVAISQKAEIQAAAYALSVSRQRKTRRCVAFAVGLNRYQAEGRVCQFYHKDTKRIQI